MAVTTVTRPRNEGLDTFDLIRELDTVSPIFEDNQLPFNFDQNTYNSHKFLFDAINSKIKQFDSDAIPIDETTEVNELKDIDKVKYFDQYRSYLSQASEDLTFFSLLSPSHKKRIIDANALEMANVTNAIYQNIPLSLEKNEVKQVLDVYNQYFKRAWMPYAVQTMDEYSQRHSKDNSGGNLKRAFNTRVSMLLEGISVDRDNYNKYTPWEDDENASKWWGDKAKEWIDSNKTLEDPTGIYALSDDEVKRDYGTGWFTGMPTTKSAYAWNRIAEDMIGQSVNSVLPIATGIAGTKIGTSIGGPVGAVGGFTVGLAGGLSPGYFVEMGAFSQEMKELWRSAREQAKFVKSTGKYSDKEFFDRYKINIGQAEGSNIFITADQLSDEKINDVVNNLAKTYAITSTMMEGITSGLSIATGGLMKFGFGKLGSAFVSSKVGQQAIANSMYQKLSKPLMHASLLSKEMAQEGLTEYYQEDLNMAMMEPYLPDYQKQYADKQDRLNQAAFMGAVTGGGMHVGGSGFSYGADRFKAFKERKANLGDVQEITGRAKDVEAEIKENRQQPFINEHDLAVQIAIAANGGAYQNPYVDNVNRMFETDESQMTNALFQARGKYNENVKNPKNLVKLLGTNKAKQVMAKMGLNATNFTDSQGKPLFMSRKDMMSVFGVEQLTKLDIDLSVETAEVDSDLGEYEDPSKDVIEPSENPDVVYENDQVIGTELSKKIAEHKEVLNRINEAKSKKQKIGQGLLDKRDRLYQQVLELRDGKEKRNKIRDVQKNIDTIGTEIDKTVDPVNVLKLNVKKLVGKDKNKTSFLSDKKTMGTQISLKVVSKSEEVNPVTNQKEPVYVVEPFTVVRQQGVAAPKPSGGKFKVFQSEIEVANDGGRPPKRWKLPVPEQEEVVNTKQTSDPAFIDLTSAISQTDKNANDAVEVISNSGTQKGYRDVATFLSDKLKGVKIRFDKRVKVQGKYSPKTNTITLNPSNFASRQDMEFTILHEGIHAVTSNVINDFTSGKLDKKSDVYKSVSDLDTLFNALKNSLTVKDQKGLVDLDTFVSKLKDQGLTVKEEKIARELREQLYGFKNLKEFVAEVLINPELQNKLNTIKVEDMGLWDKIKTMIAKFVGMENTPEMMSILSQALTKDLIETATKPKKIENPVVSDRQFSSFDQPIEIGSLENATKAKFKDIKSIRKKLTTVQEEFQKTGYKTMEAFMSVLGGRIYKNPTMLKADDGSILILDKLNRAVAEIKSDPKAKGLRQERIILDLPNKKPFYIEALSVNNADTQVAKYNIPPIIDEKISDQEFEEAVKLFEGEKAFTSDKPKTPSRGAKAVKGQPPPSIEDLFDEDDMSSLVNTGNEEIYLANNALESLTNEDYLQDDESKLIKWGANKGLLGPTNKKRVYRRFEYGFLSRLKQGLPVNYFEEYVKKMNEALENTVLGPHFKKWAKEYAVNLQVNLDMAGIFDEGFNVEVDKTFDTDLNALAQVFQDAYDLTEESVRQGYGLKKTGELDGNTTADNFSKIDQGFFRMVDVFVTEELSKAINEEIQNTNNVNEFITNLSRTDFIEENNFYLPNSKTLRDILEVDYNGEMTHLVNRFYLSNKNRNKTRTNRGGSKQDVPSYTSFYFKSTDRMVIYDKIKNTSVLVQNQKLYPYGNTMAPEKLRTRAAERVLDDLGYITLKDAFRAVKQRDKDGNPTDKLEPKIFSYDTQMFTKLIRSFIQKNKVPLFIRGDGTLIPIVDIKANHIASAHSNSDGTGNLKIYWNRELKKVKKEHGVDAMRDVRNNWVANYLSIYNKDNTELFANNPIMYDAANIARHEAYKKLYGDDYWVHMSMHKLVHRAKIPFGNGLSNDKMPSKKLRTFDPGVGLGKNSKSTMLIYKQGEVEPTEVSLVQNIDGQWQYIWDGMTMTSERVHSKEYNKYLATNKKARRAKTFIYQRDERGAMMIKHQEMTFFMGDDVSKVEITDGKGNDVATIRRKNGDVTILDAEGNYLDYLNTPDENKVMTGEFANMMNQSVEIDGGSVNLINFPRDKDKAFGKFYKQLLNYFPDSKFQKSAMDFFDDPDPKRPRSPQSFFRKLTEIVKNPKKLDQLKIAYSNATIDGLPLMLKRNAQVGVGFHVSESGTNDNVTKNALVQPALEFPVYGTTLDFRMDTMGNIADNEIVLPYDHSIADNIRKIMGKPDASKFDINRFLSKKPIEILLVRSPVTSRYGYRVLKVKSLESIGDTFMVNPKIVKQVLEADGDGDKGSITFLNNKAKPFLELLKKEQSITEGLKLKPNEVLVNDINIGSLTGLADSMDMMGYGKQAVGQIANVQRNVGILQTWFKRMTVEDEEGNVRVIRLRKLNDMVVDDRLDNVYELQDVYRRYIQAAADHAKMLLLNPESWNYSREKLYSLAFYYEDNETETLSENDFNAINSMILKPMTTGGAVLNGKDMSRTHSQLNFKDYIRYSRDYENYIMERDNMTAEVLVEGENQESTTLKYTVDGNTNINHTLEHMIVSVAKHAELNNYDETVFESTPAEATYFNNIAIKEHVDKWTNDLIAQAEEEAGVKLSDLEGPERDNLARNIQKKLNLPRQTAIGFNNEFQNAINKRNQQKIDPNEAVSFSSNEIQFNQRAAEVIEKYLALQERSNYTKAQKMQFTLSMLMDTVNPQYKNQRDTAKFRFPPTDPENSKMSLLDPKIMSEYYDTWNQTRNDFKAGKTLKKQPIVERTIDYQKEEFYKKGCMSR